MPKFFRKVSVVLLSFACFASVIMSMPGAASAQLTITPAISICDIMDAIGAIIPGTDPWYDQTICTFSGHVFDPSAEEMFGERYTYAQVGWIVNSLVLQTPFVGSWFRHGFIRQIIDLFTYMDKGGERPNLAKLGVYGMLFDSMTFMYENPPASGVKTVKDTLAKFSIAKPAYAQGYGYSSLSGIEALWAASRNTAYMIMVILLIASGFMIIFRTRINPQTTVTVQLLIPRIVVTLVGITFSYAIAGLVIDLVYVVLALIISGLSTTGIINFTGTITFLGAGNFSHIGIYYIVLLFLMTLLFALSVLGIFAAIGTLLIAVAVFFLLFKVWFMLLKTYLMILFLVIAGPWYIMLGLMPTSSNNVGFGAWLRALISNAAVFIVVPVMFLLNIIIWSQPFGGMGAMASTVAYLLQIISDILAAFGAPIPAVSLPGGGNLPNLPLFSGNGTLAYLGLGFAILALIPKAAEMVRDALRVPAFKYGSAFGEAAWGGIQPFARKYSDITSRSATQEAATFKAAGDYAGMAAAEARGRKAQQSVSDLEKTVKGM